MRGKGAEGPRGVAGPRVGGGGRGGRAGGNGEGTRTPTKTPKQGPIWNQNWSLAGAILGDIRGGDFLHFPCVFSSKTTPRRYRAGDPYPSPKDSGRYRAGGPRAAPKVHQSTGPDRPWRHQKFRGVPGWAPPGVTKIHKATIRTVRWAESGRQACGRAGSVHVVDDYAKSFSFQMNWACQSGAVLVPFCHVGAILVPLNSEGLFW